MREGVERVGRRRSHTLDESTVGVGCLWHATLSARQEERHDPVELREHLCPLQCSALPLGRNTVGTASEVRSEDSAKLNFRQIMFVLPAGKPVFLRAHTTEPVHEDH